MHIQVKGKQIDVGTSLTEYVEENLSEAISKYFDRPVDAMITFSKDRHAFRCDAHVHLPTGLIAQSTATAADVYAAYEASADKVEKQLRRYKRRLRNHHRDRRKPVEVTAAPAYVLEASAESAEQEEPETLQPAIIAEMTETIQSLSVGEAVMQMELAGAPVLVFRNEGKSSGLNIVYRREDGNIGWIDPN